MIGFTTVVSAAAAFFATTGTASLLKPRASATATSSGALPTVTVSGNGRPFPKHRFCLKC